MKHLNFDNMFIAGMILVLISIIGLYVNTPSQSETAQNIIRMLAN